MSVDHDYLNQRLENLRTTIKADMDLEFRRRDTERYERVTKIIVGAVGLIGVVIWTVLLTLEIAG